MPFISNVQKLRGDALTGGGLRALAKRRLRRLRETGDRLTGGGLRSLAKRQATKSLRSAMSHPFLKALGRNLLRPFPGLSARLYRLLATAPDAVAMPQNSAATTATSLAQLSDHSLLVNSLYNAAFGCLADAGGLAHNVRALQSGKSLEDLAEDLVRSAAFRARHGSCQTVDIKYTAAVYLLALGRPPEPQGLAYWLAEGEKGATRAKVLAAVAGSDEALKKLLPGTPEATSPSQRGSEAMGGTSQNNPPSSRAETLLAPVSREAHIIEIGPSYNPIAPKAAGWNTKTLDHIAREGLIAHYRGEPGVDVNRIEEVDFIWTGGPLVDAVPTALHGTFDAFIASHVIEHTPDLIAFLDSAAVLLKPDGVVVLAIPDKRYCFDYFQPLTTTGQLLAAHAERRSRHTRRLAFDHVAYAVKNGGVGAWAQHPAREMRFFHPIEEARKLFDSLETREDYVDLHAWRFTPASFELLLLELARLDETSLRVDRITPANGCEFFAWLRRGGGVAAASLTEIEIAAQRLALLKRTLLETQEQIDWLLAGECSLATEPRGCDTPRGN
jgi:predicted SAM-dependent methyltransferase